MTNQMLTRRALNRATLARQMLLSREKTTPLRAIERLVGLQAQLARPPFIALWSRLLNFRPEALLTALRRRQVVRALMMRCTLHLVSARDYVELRATIQPALERAIESSVRKRAKTLNMEKLLVRARQYLDEEPCTLSELRARLWKGFPKYDEQAIGYAVRTHLPLVHVASETPWGYRTPADLAIARSWLGRGVSTVEARETLVLRYLAAFGPATVSDAQTWSGLPGLRPAFDALRTKLRTFRDERGRELFDLPQAVRPDEDVVAPVRFLPDYDNLILSHSDRTRFLAPEHRPLVFMRNMQILPTFLVDGFVAGTWRVEQTTAGASLALTPFGKLSQRAWADLEREANKLLHFLAPEACRTLVKRNAMV
jgi:hypothetical protein